MGKLGLDFNIFIACLNLHRSWLIDIGISVRRKKPPNNIKLIKLVKYSGMPSISIGITGKIVQFLRMARQFLSNSRGILPRDTDFWRADGRNDSALSVPPPSFCVFGDLGGTACVVQMAVFVGEEVFGG